MTCVKYIRLLFVIINFFLVYCISGSSQASTQQEKSGSKSHFIHFKKSSLHKRRVKNLALVKKYIQANEGKKALEILSQWSKSKNNFDVLLLMAESYAEMDDPISALAYYDCALRHAKKRDEYEVAYSGVAKMLFWLDKYMTAGSIYRKLLTYPLDKKSRELALAGRVKSLAYADRVHDAYVLVPKQVKFTTPQMVVAASQASLWAGWPDITKHILCAYRPIWNKIDPQSSLGKDMLDLRWQLNLATARNNVAPNFYMYSDAENFIKRDYFLDYSRYWSQCWQSRVGLERVDYAQNGNRLAADSIYLSQIWQPSRDLVFQGRLEPANYASWHPFLWSTRVNYTPNDLWRVGFNATKEVVETLNAFNAKITDNLYSGDVRFSPLPYFQLNGSLSHLNFNDSNVRKSYFVSAALLASTHFGITLEARQRGYTDALVSPNYFSPIRYQEKMALIKLGRKWGSTWRYYFTLGKGRQTITPDQTIPQGSSPTELIEFGLNGPVTHCIVLNAYYGWAKQAAAFQNSPDYSYQYGAIALNFLF